MKPQGAYLDYHWTRKRPHAAAVRGDAVPAIRVRGLPSPGRGSGENHRAGTCSRPAASSPRPSRPANNGIPRTVGRPCNGSPSRDFATTVRRRSPQPLPAAGWPSSMRLRSQRQTGREIRRRRHSAAAAAAANTRCRTDSVGPTESCASSSRCIPQTPPCDAGAVTEPPDPISCSSSGPTERSPGAATCRAAPASAPIRRPPTAGSTRDRPAHRGGVAARRASPLPRGGATSGSSGSMGGHLSGLRMVPILTIVRCRLAMASRCENATFSIVPRSGPRVRKQKWRRGQQIDARSEVPRHPSRRLD